MSGVSVEERVRRLCTSGLRTDTHECDSYTEQNEVEGESHVSVVGYPSEWVIAR